MPRWLVPALLVAVLVATVALTDDWGDRSARPDTCLAQAAPGHPVGPAAPGRC